MQGHLVETSSGLKSSEDICCSHISVFLARHGWMPHHWMAQHSRPHEAHHWVVEEALAEVAQVSFGQQKLPVLRSFQRLHLLQLWLSLLSWTLQGSRLFVANLNLKESILVFSSTEEVS